MWFLRKHAQWYHWIGFSFFLIFGSIKVIYRETKAGNLNQLFKMTKGTLDAFKIKK